MPGVFLAAIFFRMRYHQQLRMLVARRERMHPEIAESARECDLLLTRDVLIAKKQHLVLEQRAMSVPHAADRAAPLPRAGSSL